MKKFLENVKDFFLGWWENSVLSFAFATLAVACVFVWGVMNLFSQTLGNTILITLVFVMIIFIVRWLIKQNKK